MHEIIVHKSCTQTNLCSLNSCLCKQYMYCQGWMKRAKVGSHTLLGHHISGKIPREMVSYQPLKNWTSHTRTTMNSLLTWWTFRVNSIFGAESVSSGSLRTSCVQPGMPKVPKIRSLYIFVISSEKHGEKLIFCLQINTKVFYKLIGSLWVRVDRHAQSTQNNKFTISL